jgi:hypothetical protein
MTGENAIKKSSLRRALDCCATSAKEQAISKHNPIEEPMFAGREQLTICEIDQVQPLVATGVFQSLEPKLARSICMSPGTAADQHIMLEHVECTICLPVEHDPLGDSYLLNVRLRGLTERRGLTMLSWVSFNAESFARTASSVYAILIDRLIYSVVDRG